MFVRISLTLSRVVNLLAPIHLKITKNRKKKAHGEIRYNQLSLSIGVHDKEEKGELKKMRR